MTFPVQSCSIKTHIKICTFCSHNGVIYVIGGDDGTSNLSSVEMYNPKVKSCICNNNKLLLNYPPDGHLERVGCEHDDRKELHWRGSHWQAKLLVSRLSWAWSDAQIWGNYPIILSHRKRFGFGAVSVGPGKMPVCLLWVDLRKLPQHCQRKRFRFMPLPLSVQLVWGKWEVILHTGKCRSGQEQLTTSLTSVWGDLSITLASTTNFGFIVFFLILQ